MVDFPSQPGPKAPRARREEGRSQGLAHPQETQAMCPQAAKVIKMGLSENVGYIPNEIAIFHRDNDQQNHWV